MNTALTFLKLGGSLITEKEQASTPRSSRITRIAEEIASSLASKPKMQMLIGHGSGSFGHVAAEKYGTREGVSNPAEWQGFVEVWQQAATLNHIVMDALHAVDLPALAFPPSASVRAKDGVIISWDISPIRAALENGLIPIVYGDVVFDEHRGGTVLSTEDLFHFLARQLQPKRVLLATNENVYADYPKRKTLLPEITPINREELISVFRGAEGADVTGGMGGKVQRMLDLVAEFPDIEVRIFSGAEPGTIEKALDKEKMGTLIRHRTS